MALLNFFPLFGFFLGGYYSLYVAGIFPQQLNHPLFSVHLPSGQLWAPTIGVVVILLGLITLYIELFNLLDKKQEYDSEYINQKFVEPNGLKKQF